MEFNPSEPLQLGNGKTLKYSFVEIVDFLTQQRVFDLLYYHATAGVYIPLEELRNNPNDLELRPNGRCALDDAGVIKMQSGLSATLYTNIPPTDPSKFDISNLMSYRVKSPTDGHTPVAAFELLLGHWLPMPMFEHEIDGSTATYPIGWCRVKIERIAEANNKGIETFRLIWAFDTGLSKDELSNLRPCFWEQDGDKKEFSLCSRADELLGFLSTGDEFSAFSDYIHSLLGNPQDQIVNKYIGYYIYLINFLRLSGAAPEVTLHRNPRAMDVPVDLVLDIGNSRTCGMLFEDGDFTKAMMMRLRDLSHPEREYDKSFDMRLVFRMADFGNDIVLDDDDLFQWKSFVRVGEEAKTLLYRSLEEEGLSQKTTGYSSPKRYLWDIKPFEGNWENLSTIDDPFNVLLSNNIYVAGLSELFDTNGEYIERAQKNVDGYLPAMSENINYSRSSLMTMAMIEIFQQAMTQINSIGFRTKHGNVDCRRVLRNIILTCPTAMPHAEQIRLRECAEDAYDALSRSIDGLAPANIYPTSMSLKMADGDNLDYDMVGRMWSFDEASCCQLVYLYAEIAQRYSGEIHKFFELKGHVRPEDKAQGYEGNSLTIGSVDIGAGTTDVMICSYQCRGKGRSMLTPTPLYWDSFYLAGDDILRNMVQNVVIEGKEYDNPMMGNICSALIARLCAMSDEQLAALPCLTDNNVYKEKIDNVLRCGDADRRQELLRAFAGNLMQDFFGKDSAMMSYKDRRCRLDFNTQVSVPLMQFFLELLRLKRPSKVYSFTDIFHTNVPANYLMDYFAAHFGFRFEELQWRFDPEEVAEIVKATMEPLLKQLAMLLYAHKCDVILLAGRPTSLDAITELFIKYLPTTPDKLVRLNEYRVGSFFPTADGQGYFYDQKSIVAVGGMIGYLGAKGSLHGFSLDFTKMIKTMHSTANYIGEYNSRRRQVERTILTPTTAATTLEIPVFPAFIGCRQFDSPLYQARPLYAIYNHSASPVLRVNISRDFLTDPEALYIEDAQDMQGNDIPAGTVEMVRQSLVDDGKHWLDKGEFELSIK